MSNRTVKPSELKTLLRACALIKRPVFVWGPPGVGKSDIVAAVGKELDRPVIDLRMALMEPTDLRGMPYFDANTGTMQWAPPGDLPREDDETRNAILFLDELNSAPPSVQAAAYQLVLNRRVGTYKLPDNVVIVAAGNRDTDKGVTYRMPPPLANRFLHLEVEPNFDDWQEWAIDAQVHADVIGFLTQNKHYLFRFDPKSPDRSFATPRSWTAAGSVLELSLSEKMLSTAVAGCVGDGMATEFMQHRRVAAKMPSVEDVLNGKVTKLAVNEISAQYSLLISCCYQLKAYSDMLADKSQTEINDDQYHEKADNFIRFTMDLLSAEMNILAIRTALKNFKIRWEIRKLKNFEEYSNKYRKYLIGNA